MKCIYVRTNLVNGKQYVGQANDFKQREADWRCSNFQYAGILVNRAREKYGRNNWKVDILRECETQEELNEWERYYIKELNTKYPNGYNLTDGGGGLSGYYFTDEHKKNLSESKRGKHVSEETKKKLSEILRGRRFTEEHKKKISISNMGRECSAETRKKISEAHKGKKMPEEVVRKMSERFSGTGNPFAGKHHTKETIEKIRASNIGRPGWNKGKTYDELFTSEKAQWLREHAINNAIKTAQLDLDENVIKIWNSAKEASRELGIEYTGICKCRKGEFKTYHGFIWKPYTD